MADNKEEIKATICFWVSSFGSGIFNEFTNVSLTP
jgi:hypothetical protein